MFSGKASVLGGLSNENRLAEICPDEFKKDNKWSDLANKIFFSGADTINWNYKSFSKEEQKKQKTCLIGVLKTFGLSHEDKESVAGWMLFEMLNEIPR